MNFRRTNLVKIASIYAVLFAYFKEENKHEEEPYKSLLENLLSLIDFYLYGEGKKEIPLLTKAIAEVNEKMEGRIVNANTVLNMLDVFIENEKLFVKHGEKRRHLNHVQDLILLCPEYDFTKISDLDDGNIYEEKLSEILKEHGKKAS